jgi:aminopeptidase
MGQVEMIETKSVNIQEIAGRIVRDSLRLKPGNNFLIFCSDPYYYPFVEEVALAAIEAGAYPFIRMSSDRISRKTFLQPVEYLDHHPDVSMNIIEKTDVVLNIATSRRAGNLKDIPPEKFAVAAQAEQPVEKKILDMNRDKVRIKFSSIILPSPDHAEKYNLTFEEYSDIIWSGLDVDYKVMSGRAKKLKEILSKADKVHITSDEGTDLTLSVKNRRVDVDDGVMDEDDIEAGMAWQNLPAGEVCCAPLESSTEGKALFQYNIFRNEPLVNLELTFSEGKVVKAEADQGLETLKNYVDSQSGEKWRIAELGIGINPNINRIIGSLALDEKITGTIHIAIGENRVFGGINESSHHHDFVMQKPTVTVDGRMIMERGELLCD